MLSFLDRPAYAVAALLVWVVALVLVIARLDRVVPRGSRLEAAVQRWSATAQAGVVVGGVLWLIAILYKNDVTTWRWLTVGVLVVAVWSCRWALSDWANGVMLRSEGTLRPGGRVGTGTGGGRIRRLGLRSVEVEAQDGHLMRLPYTGLARADVVVSSDETAARSHTFPVQVDGHDDIAALSEAMTTTALLSPWSSAQPAPTVRVVERSESGVRFEVTVHPVDPAFVSRVEEAVRESVGQITATGAPRRHR